MKIKMERVFGRTARGVMVAVNPIKKLVVHTHCMAHKYINHKSIELLKREGYTKEWEYFCKYINNINDGVTWADQDFKSTNHFYHANQRKGLFGFSNALEECIKYNDVSLKHLELGDIKGSMFYLGAACHLIQDTTVPHHVNNRLFKQHRPFELWIIKNIAMGHSFDSKKAIKRYKTIKEYIENNALVANEAYYKYEKILDKDKRYMQIATLIIQEAEVTTAGFMLDFYEILKEKLEFN